MTLAALRAAQKTLQASKAPIHLKEGDKMSSVIIPMAMTGTAFLVIGQNMKSLITGTNKLEDM
eukprot:CAMPEP_0182912482 /NCGR_PEP_ID=MMETSP0034_2-20130328/37540_1 /TAXON_ID=156128 /ORGANISM="Nephroselmis pyriformis, Strain CCMP717" /LENGTH=62 /DNA_ID=CAMNT_0025049157 /DNA_START=42 /DNA_END=230 /DNA_ORIENTATION=+